MPRAALTWFAVAAGLGTVHAAASLYWALGGDALADTVGAWSQGVLRLVCWAGSALLVAYGLANTAAANLALTGIMGAVDDLAATRGHAWLWDPLFLAWGLALGVGLWQTRRRPAPSQGTVAPTGGR